MPINFQIYLQITRPNSQLFLSNTFNAELFLTVNKSGWRDDRNATSLSVSDPWERCLDSGLKRKGGSCCCCYQAVSANPSSTPLASYDPQHVQIRTLKSHFNKQRPAQVSFYFVVTFWTRTNDCLPCIVETYVLIFPWWFSQKKERVCTRRGQVLSLESLRRRKMQWETNDDCSSNRSFNFGFSWAIHTTNIHKLRDMAYCKRTMPREGAYWVLNSAGM